VHGDSTSASQIIVSIIREMAARLILSLLTEDIIIIMLYVCDRQGGLTPKIVHRR